MTESSRFMALFPSNPRSRGAYKVATAVMATEYRPLDDAAIRDHLNGAVGTGGVPILDDNTCSWAAININASKAEVPLAQLDERIQHLKIPVLACRSKSGGAHVYAFFDEPIAAAKARAKLARWAVLLGYPRSQIFPTMTTLRGGPGKLALGQWLNFPYLGGNGTQRYCIFNSRKLSLDSFLNAAESIRIKTTELAEIIDSEHAEAPPCIQEMMRHGVGPAGRRSALYHSAVYFLQAFPGEAHEKTYEFNFECFQEPLTKVQVTHAIGNAKRPGRWYHCDDEPMRSLCDRAACLRRRHGVGSQEASSDGIVGMPEFTGLTKRIYPRYVRWSVWVDGKLFDNIETTALMSWIGMRALIAEHLNRVAPMITQTEWDRILSRLMVNVKIVDAQRTTSILDAAAV